MLQMANIWLNFGAVCLIISKILPSIVGCDLFSISKSAVQSCGNKFSIMLQFNGDWKWGFRFAFKSWMIDVISTISRLNEVVGQIVIAGNGIYIFRRFSWCGVKLFKDLSHILNRSWFIVKRHQYRVPFPFLVGVTYKINAHTDWY